MARKARLEIEGGLYHVITRGNDRRDIFHSADDHSKFLSLLAKQKERAKFYLYAYCLMTNHVHLLIERQSETLGSTMQRLLTGYSQYYNRRYKHVGHVFQGRYKPILCQSQTYLTKLVRYIHLNPVRARMVESPEQYPYSSHRAYLGTEPSGITDVDPVLRHFGKKREQAVKHYIEFMGAPGGRRRIALFNGGERCARLGRVYRCQYPSPRCDRAKSGKAANGPAAFVRIRYVDRLG